MKDKQEIRSIPAIGRWLLFIAGAALLVLVGFYFDASARAWITQHQSPGLRNFMRAVSQAGDWPEHVGVGLVLLGLAWWRGSKKWMRVFAAMILACALAGVAARVIKISTGRARPNVQTEAQWNGPRLSPRFNAFPSGHTAASTAFFATLALASWRVGLGLMIVPVLIGFSRMYVAAHHLSDVVCAAVIGVLAAIWVVQWKWSQIENRKSKIEN